MSVRPKIVGVLGGMGPAATLDFYARIIAATKAGRDQDHIRLIIDSNPQVPDRNAAVAGSGPSPAPALIAMAKGLRAAGADFLVMPCNAAHAFVDEIKRAIDLPLLSIIEATAADLQRKHPHARRAGILASTGCLDANLYQTALRTIGVEAIVPQAETRAQFMSALARIKTGDTGATAKREMQAVAAALIERGAEALIAGCTEVPIVLAQDDVTVPLLNSTDSLVAATIATAHQETHR